MIFLPACIYELQAGAGATRPGENRARERWPRGRTGTRACLHDAHEPGLRSRDRARPARAKSDWGRGGGWYGAASFFSIGDISTKLATRGGVRIGFVVTLVIGYTAGTALLQLGYQASGALTVAGLATLLTNALPIAAGTIVLDEPVPPGALGRLAPRV